MLKRNLEQIWSQLRAKKPQLSHYLEEVRIEHFRGIRELVVPFAFPVSVIAGPNACGKSTVLFTCACAYKDETAGVRDRFPSTLFPNLQMEDQAALSDSVERASFEFHYIQDRERGSMRWSRGPGKWNRSYGGRKGADQPRRRVYLRTLANLTNLSEVRSFLKIATGDFSSTALTADLIAFATRILPLRYRDVRLIARSEKELLFVTRDDQQDTRYSEFHMSAGERAILRMSKDLSTLRDALVLIDEIEAGLHPFSQQQTMLELQRLALRNNLQIIVTSHSPVVLDCVPPEGRIFLSRGQDNVVVEPPYRDILQRAFFGQSLDRLSLLCEDEIAESFILGVLDVIAPRLLVSPQDLMVGRDTGKDNFEQHIEELGKFRLLDQFLFILDGDARHLEGRLQASGSRFGANVEPLFLPGESLPEAWVWDALTADPAGHAEALGISGDTLTQFLSHIGNLYASAADKPANIAKNKMESLAEALQRSAPQVVRQVAARELRRGAGEVRVFADRLEDAILRWRAPR